MARRMARDPLWRETDGREEAVVFAEWLEIAAAAARAGGEWTWLASRARRFPFALARRVVNHFRMLAKLGVKIEHPGKLAWSALADEDFDFSEFSVANLDEHARHLEAPKVEPRPARAFDDDAAKKPRDVPSIANVIRSSRETSPEDPLVRARRELGL